MLPGSLSDYQSLRRRVKKTRIHGYFTVSFFVNFLWCGVCWVMVSVTVKYPFFTPPMPSLSLIKFVNFFRNSQRRHCLALYGLGKIPHTVCGMRKILLTVCGMLLT